MKIVFVQISSNELCFIFLSIFCYRLKTSEVDNESSTFNQGNDDLGFLLLAIAFNSVIFVGPSLRLIYDSISWCCEKQKNSKKKDNNKNMLKIWCTDNMVCDGVDSNHEDGPDTKISENDGEGKSEAFNNRRKSNSSSIDNKQSTYIKRGELDQSEFVEEENYIMKSSSSSFESSNRLDESLSSSSQDIR